MAAPRSPLARLLGWPLVAAALLPLALLAACGSDDDASQPPSGPVNWLDPAVTTTVPESQREALSRGHLKWEDYEAAFFAYVACLDEHAVPHREPELNERRSPPRWTVGIGPYQQDQSDEVNRVSSLCFDEHLLATEQAWDQQEGRSERELQALLEDVARCFNEYTGESVGSWAELQDWPLDDPEWRKARFGCQLLILEGDGGMLGNWRPSGFED